MEQSHYGLSPLQLYTSSTLSLTVESVDERYGIDEDGPLSCEDFEQVHVQIL